MGTWQSSSLNCAVHEMDDEAPMRRNPLISALLLAGALALGGCGDDPAAEGAAAGGPPGGMQLPVETVTLQPEPLEGGLQTVGSLRADESVVVRPEVGGRIERIHFEEGGSVRRSEEHTSELQSRENLVCRLLLEKKKKQP